MFARRVTTAGRKATDPDRKAKGFTVTASVSNRLGGVFANRGAYCLNPAGLFSLEPAELVVTTNPNLHEDHVRALKAAAEEGMAGVVAYLVAKGLVLNASTEDIGQVTDWVEAFPGAGRVRRQHLGSGIYRFEACFTADSAEFMVTADYARNHPAKLAILKDISQSIFEIPEPAASGSGPLPAGSCRVDCACRALPAAAMASKATGNTSMSKTLKTKTMTVQRDEEGPFIRWNGRTFRPDPYLRKDTSQNLEVRSDLARMGMPVGPILDHVTPRAGDRVTVSIDPSTRTDNIGVFTDIDRDGLRTREVWPEGVAEGQGNFLTWSDETAPLRPELDDDGDGPVPPPAPRR